MLGIAVGPAPAQDVPGWPTRPIRLVVGFGAGGGTDIAARLVAEPLAEILGSPVVVENRPGAGGMTAADAVAKSPKDGYTALMMSNAHAISAVMYKTLRYDPVNDFQMVSMVATAGLVLVTRPDFPGKDLAGVLAAVRANPGKLNFGSAGVGTTQQFAGELMKQTGGLNITRSLPDDTGRGDRPARRGRGLSVRAGAAGSGPDPVRRPQGDRGHVTGTKPDSA